MAEKSTDHGGRSGMAAIIDGNAKTFEEFAEGGLDPAEVDRLNGECRRLLDDGARFLEARRAAGFVRHCHGDLHLRNICMYDGEPTLFDAIEFSKRLSNIDVLYDLAFLLMDLDHRDLRHLANIVLNRYLDITADTGGLKAMPLFLAVRAAIRSHVNAAMTATVGGGVDDQKTGQEARSYLSLALAYVSPPPARVVAVGGLSGSGKSRLGRELAPYMGAPPGARLVRSDVMRKRLAGISLLARLGAEGYTEEMTERTYRELYEEARTALDAGYSVIADGVFAKLKQRQAIEAVAAEAGVPFQGIWLEAPRETMEQRIRDRRQNVSDATADVVRKQLSYDLGPLTWPRIDSSGPREETVSQGLRLLAL
jgi:predicted kinase